MPVGGEGSSGRERRGRDRRREGEKREIGKEDGTRFVLICEYIHMDTAACPSMSVPDLSQYTLM